MKKSTALHLINSQFSSAKLNHANTTFASLIEGRPNWWMNIKLNRFDDEINIILVDKPDLIWLQIPANTFTNLGAKFRIWEEKNAVDIYISSDFNDRYFKDVAPKSSGLDFKPFIKERVPIPNELLKQPENKKKVKESRKNQNPLPSSSQFEIQHNQKDISFKKLFEDYLRGTEKITLQDPYIRYHHQFENLVEFCQLLEEVKKDDQDLHFELLTWNSEDFKNNSLEYLSSLKESLSESGIKFTYKFEDNHDRFIQTDTGWKILLGRGLDIFHKVNSKISLAHRDQTKRRCKACEITYLKM